MSLKQNDICYEQLEEKKDELEECMFAGCGGKDFEVNDSFQVLCTKCNSVQVELPDYEPEA